MPLTEYQIRLTSTGACLSKFSVLTETENCFMLAVFISMIRNCNGFKVDIMKYQLTKQICLVLNKNHQYNISIFKVLIWISPLTKKSFRVSEQRFCKRKVFLCLFLFCFVVVCFAFYTTSILVKVTKIIWWSIWIQMDFNRNFAYFLYHHSFHWNATKTFFFNFTNNQESSHVNAHLQNFSLYF